MNRKEERTPQASDADGGQAMSHRTYQLRAHVKASGHVRLEQVLVDCATLYNAALQERRDAWKMGRVSVTKFDQTRQLTQVRRDLPNWGELSTRVSRGVLCRIDRAFQSFFRRVKAGEKPGYPRFKPRRRFTTLELAEVSPGMVKVRQDGLKAFIRVKGLPAIHLRLKRPLPDSKELKSLRLVKRPNGWYADLVYQVAVSPAPATGRIVGVDLGVNQRLTLSDGGIIPGRVFDRAKERRLHRAVSRSRKGSETRRKRRKALGRETRRAQVRNRNACHQVTTALVGRYDFIGVENLRIKNMIRSAKGTAEEPGRNVAAKSGLNRSVLEQSWGMILNQLSYKAEWAGRKVEPVDPRNTSKICSTCGGLNESKAKVYRVFVCEACGLVMDRDLNAAKNIKTRALAQQGWGNPLEPSSPQAPAGAAD